MTSYNYPDRTSAGEVGGSCSSLESVCKNALEDQFIEEDRENWLSSHEYVNISNKISDLQKRLSR